jgi:hypothetical protein|tara:strand:+ start:41 stop:334 length:294 start_codon:yes stop_codon:yes gene_type:complete
MTNETLRKKWEAKINKCIAGKKIIRAVYHHQGYYKFKNKWSKEPEYFEGTDNQPYLYLDLDDGNWLKVMCDDEGNSCGALHTSFKDVRCFPQLREGD